MSTKSKLALVSATFVTLFTSSAFAQTVNSPATNKEDVFRWAAAGAGFAIAIAALGGTLAQGRATAAALEGISRNPGAASKIQTPMILGLALIESLVLFALVIAYLLQSQIKF
jgi:F-type H+-transporting ATPase subunit c